MRIGGFEVLQASQLFGRDYSEETHFIVLEFIDQQGQSGSLVFDTLTEVEQYINDFSLTDYTVLDKPNHHKKAFQQYSTNPTPGEKIQDA
jgi:hypothetical protein